MTAPLLYVGMSAHETPQAKSDAEWCVRHAHDGMGLLVPLLMLAFVVWLLVLR